MLKGTVCIVSYRPVCKFDLILAICSILTSITAHISYVLRNTCLTFSVLWGSHCNHN